MARRVVRVHRADGATLREGIAAIQAEMDVSPEFPAVVEAAAAQAARTPRLPELDRTDIPFITIDPESALDLDQAMHLARDGSGYLVHYAIADVAAFVEPGGPVDEEANRRGQTLYGADSKIPLHPKVLSEDAASLLPGQIRPAVLWTIRVDGSGEGTEVAVERALVRSRAKLDYESVQQQVDGGTADPMFDVLGEVGRLRLEREAARGGVSLPLPEQEIFIEGDDWALEFRKMSPVEEWNAQISLLTGMAAAHLMVEAKVGVLRTLPPVDPRDVERLRRTAKGLGIDWPEVQSYPDFVRSLDPSRANHAAMVLACTELLRGSGYVGFNGALPEQPEHSAVASTYSHVTAPIRRLVDRYGLEICLAVSAGTEVPGWVLERLDQLPRTMQQSSQRASQYENSVVALLEAAVLRKQVGRVFEGVVVQADNNGGTTGSVVIQEPAIEATVCSAEPLPVGTDVRVKLVEADVEQRSVRFELETSG